MARTTQEIYNSIVLTASQNSHLQGLNSPSNSALWRNVFLTIAFIIRVFEEMQDLFRLEVLEIANNAITGTAQWYQKKILAFQFSNSVAYYINEFCEWNVISEQDRIIKYASVSEGYLGVVLCKAAKEVNGLPAPLDATELEALKHYISRVKFAGTRTIVSSMTPDRLQVSFEIFYNPTANEALVRTNTEQAITDFLRNLPFNGAFYVEKLQDAVQALPYVISVQVNFVRVNFGNGGLYSVSRYYSSVAGYIHIDTTFPLAASLVFTPSYQ